MQYAYMFKILNTFFLKLLHTKKKTGYQMKLSSVLCFLEQLVITFIAGLLAQHHERLSTVDVSASKKLRKMSVTGSFKLPFEFIQACYLF